MAIIYQNAQEALEGLLKDNMTIMCGGFGLCGIPENLINAIAKSGINNITMINNNCGIDGHGLGILIQQKQIKKICASYVGANNTLQKQFLAGELELELNPQGTLAERIRAGGAGIGGFYTKTGYGTVVAEGKEVRIFNGEKYILETALRADIAIIKGWKADKSGNVIYNKTAQNFNLPMATAADITICEVEEIVENGELDANHIHTPSIYIKRLLQGTNYEKFIEHITTRPRP